jgi:ABC-2 type transport system ATP-binding protein
MEEQALAVDVEGLSKEFPRSGGSKALNNISLRVQVGQILCLVGPNGSGKTTLLKILAGLIRPTAGTVRLMGVDALKHPARTHPFIGWLPAEERSGFYGRLSPMQNISFFSSLYPDAGRQTDRHIGNLALQVDIRERMDQTMFKISAGLRQKVGLVRALAHNPSVLLLDEPFRYLDPHATQRVRRLLKDHLTRNQKKTVVMATHQLEEARKLADVIVFLNNGEKVLELTSLELKKELQDETLEEFYMKLIRRENVGDDF